MTEQPEPLHIPIRRIDPGPGLNPDFWPVSMPNGLDPAAVAPDPTSPGGPLEHAGDEPAKVLTGDPGRFLRPPLSLADQLSEGDVVTFQSDESPWMNGRFEVLSAGEPDADGAVTLQLRRAREVNP